MNTTATTQETIRAKPTIQKMLPAYSPAVESGETHGSETNDRDQGTREHGRSRVTPGVGGSLHPFEALFELHHHHFDGDDRVIDEQSEGDDERAERDPIEDAAGEQHDDKDRGEGQRHGRCHDDTDAPAEADQAHDHDDG